MRLSRREIRALRRLVTPPPETPPLWRIVEHSPGDPDPVAAPGERLLIVERVEPKDDPHEPHPATGYTPSHQPAAEVSPSAPPLSIPGVTSTLPLELDAVLHLLLDPHLRSWRPATWWRRTAPAAE